MGTKNVVIDLIKSDEIREYLQQMLDQQTEKIEELISEKEKSETEQLKQDKRDIEGKVGQLEIKLDNCNKDNELLHNENERLTTELTNAKKSVESLTEQNKALTSKLKEVEDEKKTAESYLIHEIETISEELKGYKNYFGLAADILALHDSLSEETISRIRNVLGNGNIYDLIAMASEWRNIEVIWEYTKRRIIEQDNSVDNEKLKELLMKLIEVHQCCSKGHEIELIIPDIGEKYNSDSHSIAGINTDGIINEVLLFGIREKTTRKTIYKALVKVG